MDEMKIALTKHEQRINTLERDVRELQDIRSELKTMSETLVALATEMKYTNEHLERNEEKINLIETQPIIRHQQIVTAIISALAGAAASVVVSGIFA